MVGGEGVWWEEHTICSVSVAHLEVEESLLDIAAVWKEQCLGPYSS